VEDLLRGSIIYKTAFFTESSDFVARIRLLDRSRTIKNNTGVEVLIGTTTVKGKIILLDETGVDSFAAGIRFDSPWSTYCGQPSF
jgi:hypothetical protein